MKLAEALLERRDLTNRINELKSRVSANVIVQEGDENVESVLTLLAEHDATIESLERLILAVNHTNNVAKLLDGSRTITEAIAHRDLLKLKKTIWDTSLSQASNRYRNPYGATAAVKQVLNDSTTVDFFRKKSDEIAKEYRELDVAIQGANWAIDLII